MTQKERLELEAWMRCAENQKKKIEDLEFRIKRFEDKIKHQDHLIEKYQNLISPSNDIGKSFFSTIRNSSHLTIIK